MSRFSLLLLLAPVLSGQENSLIPSKVLAQIDARCAAVRQYEFDGILTVHGQRGNAPGRMLAQAKIRLAIAQPGKYFLRIEPVDKDEYLLASDGRKSWAYVPKLKQYTEQESASVTDEGGEEEGAPTGEERDLAETFAHEVMPLLSRLAKTAQAADVNGSAALRYAGKKENWPVLRVVSKKDERDGQSLTELAIDPATLRIGRLIWTNATYSNGEKTLIRLAVDFTNFRIGEAIAEDTFIFEPPKKAKLVESVPIPGQTGSFLLNRPAPDFELKTLEGEKVRLAELRGRPVLLDFWASWCGPCRRELPRLVKLYAEYKDQGLVVLGVNDEGKKDARSYSAEANLNFPTLDDSALKAHRLYRVRSIPSVFVIDRGGKIVRFLKGARDEAELRAALKSAGL